MGGALRDRSCARRERWTGGAFALLREGIRVSTFLCSLRTYPAAAQGCCLEVVESILGGILRRDEGGVLRREMGDCVVGGALRDRSCARRERWDRGQLSRFRARGVRVSTFLCSLRTYPAAAQGCCSGVVESIFWGF